MAATKIDAEVDRLYQVPLDEFTQARNALAKQLGPSGAGVRQLQKPPVPAWAINQIYWKRRPTWDALIDAASTLRSAHAAVLSGKRADLRAAGKAHEDAIQSALEAALAVLAEGGHPATDTTRQAIATTLRGLPSDDPPGRLARTLQPGGFEMLSGIPMRGGPAPGKAAAPAAPATAGGRGARGEPGPKLSAAEAKAEARARDALTTATRALKAAEHAAGREEFEAARLAREVEKAARAVDAAQTEFDSAREALEEAQRTASVAERRREAAARRASEADRAVSAARERVRDAERELARIAPKVSR